MIQELLYTFTLYLYGSGCDYLSFKVIYSLWPSACKAGGIPENIQSIYNIMNLKRTMHWIFVCLGEQINLFSFQNIVHGHLDMRVKNQGFRNGNLAKLWIYIPIVNSKLIIWNNIMKYFFYWLTTVCNEYISLYKLKYLARDECAGVKGEGGQVLWYLVLVKKNINKKKRSICKFILETWIPFLKYDDIQCI